MLGVCSENIGRPWDDVMRNDTPAGRLTLAEALGRGFSTLPMCFDEGPLGARSLCVYVNLGGAGLPLGPVRPAAFPPACLARRGSGRRHGHAAAHARTRQKHGPLRRRTRPARVGAHPPQGRAAPAVTVQEKDFDSGPRSLGRFSPGSSRDQRVSGAERPRVLRSGRGRGGGGAPGVERCGGGLQRHLRRGRKAR